LAAGHGLPDTGQRSDPALRSERDHLLDWAAPAQPLRGPDPLPGPDADPLQDHSQHPERRPDYRRDRDKRLELYRERPDLAMDPGQPGAGLGQVRAPEPQLPAAGHHYDNSGWHSSPGAQDQAVADYRPAPAYPGLPSLPAATGDRTLRGDLPAASQGYGPRDPGGLTGHHDEPGLPARTAGDAADEDSEPTKPLPVILPGATSLPRPAPVEAPRGFFEAARPARSASVTGSVEPPPTGGQPNGSPAGRQGIDHGAAEMATVMPQPASAELERIKDLYLTAEAIGEEALDRHFDQVSQRQRELIREYFERSRHGGP